MSAYRKSINYLRTYNNDKIKNNFVTFFDFQMVISQD